MEFTLKDICYMQSGGTPKSTNHLFYGGKIPWVTISDFKNSEGDVLYKTEQTITEDGLAAINGRFFKKNTLLLAMYGSVGKTAILGVDASTNQAILGISSKDESVLNIKFNFSVRDNMITINRLSLSDTPNTTGTLIQTTWIPGQFKVNDIMRD